MQNIIKIEEKTTSTPLSCQNAFPQYGGISSLQVFMMIMIEIVVRSDKAVKRS